MPPTDAALTIAPEPWALKCDSVCFIPYSTPLRLTASTLSSISAPYASTGSCLPSIPALLYRPSIRPNSAIVLSTYDATSSSTETSAVISEIRVSDAAVPMASPALWSASPSRSTSERSAPSCASRSAAANPRPVPAPVTTTTFPPKRPSILALLEVAVPCPEYHAQLRNLVGLESRLERQLVHTRDCLRLLS